MRQIEDTTKYMCSQCSHEYQLVARTDKQEGRLPWLVVPEDASPKDADEAIAMCVCQRCLDSQSPKSPGLMAVLLSFDDVEIIEAEVQQGPSYHGPRIKRPRAPGFVMPTASTAGSSLRPKQDKGGFSLAGLARASRGGGSTGGFDLSSLSPRGSSMPEMPEEDDSSAAAPLPDADTQMSMLDEMTASASRPPRQERQDRQSRPTRAPRLSRRKPAPLRTDMGAENKRKLQAAMAKIVQDAWKSYENELQTLTGLVSALKRTRKPRVIAMLRELAEQLKVTKDTDPNDRSYQYLLKFAGAKPGWLGSRFLRYVVAETIEDLQTELHLYFDHLKPVLSLMGIGAWAMRECVFGKVMTDLRKQLEQIRKDAKCMRVEDQIAQFRGWAVYAAMIDSDERDLPGILSQIGTSEEELEDLQEQVYLFSTVVPSGSSESGGGTKIEARSSCSGYGAGMTPAVMDIDGNSVQIIKWGASTLPEANEPLRKVPAGTGAQAKPAKRRIVYREGEEYGPWPMLVFPDDTHAWSARVRTEDGKGEESIQVMGAGQMAQILCVDTESTLGTMWVYRPMIDDDTPIDIEMIWTGAQYESWVTVLSRAHMSALIPILSTVNDKSELVQALIEAFKAEVGSEDTPFMLATAIQNMLAHPQVVGSITIPALEPDTDETLELHAQ